ncbi:MAG: hypothetical protein ACOYL3_10715 [Desulfuromonadaceae bacterium]
MRHVIIFTSVICSLCTVVNCYAAEDQRRQYGEDRQRGVRAPVVPPVAPVQRPQPAYQISPSNQRNNERSQNQRSGTNGSIVSGLSPQVVNIDRLKLQSDTPTDFQFEPVLSLSIQEGESAKAEEEMKTDAVEATAEEQQEAVVEELVSAELAEEGVLDEAGPQEGQVVREDSGKTQFRIVEESNRIIVTQIEVEPIINGIKRVIQK